MHTFYNLSPGMLLIDESQEYLEALIEDMYPKDLAKVFEKALGRVEAQTTLEIQKHCRDSVYQKLRGGGPSAASWKQNLESRGYCRPLHTILTKGVHL